MSLSLSKNQPYYPDGMATTALALPKYDIVNELWLPPSKETIYRRTLFQAMYGNPATAASNGHQGLHCVYISQEEWESPSRSGEKATEDEIQQINAFYLSKYCTDYQLDLVATGARKRGLFMVAPTGTFRKDIYFPEMTGKWITHFSILFSELNSVQSFDEVKVLILDDEKADICIKYGLADCQGYISAEMADALSIQTDVQIQHRIAVKDNWVAKGTVIPLTGDIIYRKQKVDILLPLSSFKGTHPPVGKVISFDDLFFGIAFYGAREGKQYNNYKGSHSFFRWYTSNETKEWLGRQALSEVKKVGQLRKNPCEIAKKYLDSLGIDELDSNDIEMNSAYKWAQTLAADSQNLLAQHPYIVELVEKKMIPSLLTRIAQGSFIRLAGFMAANLPGLTGNVAISTAVETGRYILRRYPNRIWSDELIVDVINPHDFSKWTATLLFYLSWINIGDLVQECRDRQIDIWTRLASPSVSRNDLNFLDLKAQVNLSKSVSIRCRFLYLFTSYISYILDRLEYLLEYLDDNLLNQTYWQKFQFPDYLRGTLLVSLDIAKATASDFDGK